MAATLNPMDGDYTPREVADLLAQGDLQLIEFASATSTKPAGSPADD